MSMRLIGGDCREVLATLPADSVHCVVTSPPYYGLRDYGTAQWAGGDVACDHQSPNGQGKTGDRADRTFTANAPYRDTCGKCGATRVDRQIGLEPTPDAYLAEMVRVFREVKRVLRPDGTCWVNMGDSYCSTAPGTMGDALNQRGILSGVSDRRAEGSRKFRPETPKGFKPKDLLMMPARLALALQADGWWLRSDIIWHKPNPMPESVGDRPTSAHEHVFLLAKSARYYYDADAVREEAINEGRIVSYDGTQKNTGHENRTYPGAKPRDILVSGRNLRNVWTIATAPFSQSHFATMPPAVVERCIRAGTSERGCCAACGAPWARVTETDYKRHENWFGDKQDARHSRGKAGTGYNEPIATRTTGWAPSCKCVAGDPVPATVLDCFAGAGTTLLVADRLQRDAIGIELNPDYTRMAMDRCRDDAPLFAEPSPPPAEPPEEPRIRDLFAEPVK
jgi:DNA modification methylase